MNKLWLLLLIPLLVFGFGCVSTDTAPAADSLASRINALTDTVTKHTSVIDALKADVEKKATKTELDDLTRKVNNLPQSSSTPADVYTKAQVNQAIADAIDKLKTDKPWGTTSTTTTTTTGTIVDYAKLLDSDGDLELWIEWIDPNRDDIRFSSNYVDFQVAIKNKSDATRKYTLELRFTPDVEVAVASLSDVSPSTITDRPDMGIWTMEGNRWPDATKGAVTFVSEEGRISRNAIDKYIITVKIQEGTQTAYWTKKFYIAEVTD